MKLIHAVVSNDDAKIVANALSKEGFLSTKLNSSGGFLMSGNTTFIIATQDNLVDKAIDIIKKHSKTREQMVPPIASYTSGMFTSLPVNVTVGGATIFVTNIERFEKV